MKQFQFLHNRPLPLRGAWHGVFFTASRTRPWLWPLTCATGARRFAPGITLGCWSRMLAHGVAAVLLLGLASLASAADQPELRFVTKPFAPYAYAGANGQAAGPMVELLRVACARLQWRCMVDVLPWRRAWGMAEHGQVDGVFPIVDSPARRAVFQLSPPVVAGRYVLLARAGSPPLCNAAKRCNISGRTVAAYGPSDATASLQQLAGSVPGVHAEVEIDHETVLRKLAHGRYGANGLALVNEAVAWRLMVQGGLWNLRAAAAFKDLAYSFAFTPGNVNAKRARDFSAEMAGMCRNGELASIFERYGLAPAAACRRMAP